MTGYQHIDDIEVLEEAPLFRMVCVSRIHYSALFDHQFFLNLMRKARKNNKKEGVGGILCFSNGYFLEYAEGSEQSLTNLKNRILFNKQHHELKLIDFSAIDKRQFVNHQFSFIFFEKYDCLVEESNEFQEFFPFNPYLWTIEQQLRLVSLIQERAISGIELDTISTFRMLKTQLKSLLQSTRSGLDKQYLYLLIGYGVFVIIIILLLLVIVFNRINLY